MRQEEEKPLRNQHFSFATIKIISKVHDTLTLFLKDCQTHQIQLKYCACQKECATNQTNHNDGTVQLNGIGEKPFSKCLIGKIASLKLPSV